MAKHDVTFSLPPRSLGRSDVEFIVIRNGERHGKLAISNGSIVWFPKNTRKGHKMTWVKFDQMMKDNAKKSEKRR